MWAGVPDANGYPADCPVALPHLAALIFGSLRLVKAGPTLPEPAQPVATSAALASPAPTQQPGTVVGPPQAPQESQATAAAPGPQAAVHLPHDQGPPLGPSPGGPLFAPIRDATAIAEGIRRLPDPPSAGVHAA